MAVPNELQPPQMLTAVKEEEAEQSDAERLPSIHQKRKIVNFIDC